MKMKPKFIKEMLDLMHKHGYELDTDFHDRGGLSSIFYQGPRGGHDHFHFEDLITDLIKHWKNWFNSPSEANTKKEII